MHRNDDLRGKRAGERSVAERHVPETAAADLLHSSDELLLLATRCAARSMTASNNAPEGRRSRAPRPMLLARTRRRLVRTTWLRIVRATRHVPTATIGGGEGPLLLDTLAPRTLRRDPDPPPRPLDRKGRAQELLVLDEGDVVVLGLIAVARRHELQLAAKAEPRVHPCRKKQQQRGAQQQQELEQLAGQNTRLFVTEKKKSAIGMTPPVVVALVSCSKKHVSDLGPTLLALATHAPPRTRVLLYADEVGQTAARTCASELFGTPSSFAALELLPIEALGGPLVDYDASKGANPKAQGRFACASAKLMLQNAPNLRSAPFVLALDADALVNEPLSALWPRWTSAMRESGTLWGLVQESGESGEAPALGFGQELKDVRPSTLKQGEYYNTGVILINAAALRRRNLTHPSQLLAELSAAAKHGRSKYEDYGLGEQNLLNAWLQDHPGSVTTLPCRWNRRIDRRCGEEDAGIRHANRLLGKPRDWESTDARLAKLLSPHAPALAGGPSSMSTTASTTATTTAAASMARPRPATRRDAAWPESACTDAYLRPEWRGNRSAAQECVYLMAKRWARADVEPWHRRYHALPCAA